jgi:hypothetical protein
MGEIVHEAPDSLRALAQIEKRKAEQDGEEQHLEDVADLEDLRRTGLADSCVGATDEGADDAVGNDVKDEVDRPDLPGRVRIALGLRGLLRCERDVGKARARAPDAADHKAHDQRQSRDRLEIDERLQPNPADAAGFLDMGDARDDRAEDERRDRHFDELDETLAEERDPIIGRKGGEEPSDECAEHDRDEHLDVESRIPGTTSCSHRSPPMVPARLGHGLRDLAPVRTGAARSPIRRGEKKRRAAGPPRQPVPLTE